MHQGNYNKGSFKDSNWGSSRARNSGENYNQKNNGVKELPRRSKLVPAFIADQCEVTEEPQQIAKEVLIGNFPPKMHQCDVYRLCKASKVSPLHVEMKTIDRPHYIKVPYAFVYVRSDEDVKELITGLHNLEVNGYQLQVYSTEKLGEECQSLMVN